MCVLLYMLYINTYIYSDIRGIWFYFSSHKIIWTYYEVGNGTWQLTTTKGGYCGVQISFQCIIPNGWEKDQFGVKKTMSSFDVSRRHFSSPQLPKGFETARGRGVSADRPPPQNQTVLSSALHLKNTSAFPTPLFKKVTKLHFWVAILRKTETKGKQKAIKKTGHSRLSVFRLVGSANLSSTWLWGGGLIHLSPMWKEARISPSKQKKIICLCGLVLMKMVGLCL